MPSNLPANPSRPTDTPAGTIERTELPRDAAAVHGRDVVRVLAKIPVGAESGWHEHPCEEAGFVLTGTVRLAIRDRPALAPHAGDLVPVPPGAPRNELALGQERGRRVCAYVVGAARPFEKIAG